MKLSNARRRNSAKPALAPVLAMATLALGLGGCTSITEGAGYIASEQLTSSIQPGIDNRRSVESTLGRPSFTSQFGEPIWYYVSSTTGRKPFVRPRIEMHNVLAVRFDEAGNVVSVDNSGIEDVVYLSPDGDETPTLGRERSFFEDLFGNIGTVNAPVGPGN